MAISINNVTAEPISLPDLPYKFPAGGALVIGIDNYRASAHLQKALTAGSLVLDLALLTVGEQEQIGLMSIGAPSPLAAVNEQGTYTYDANGNCLTIKKWPAGAAVGTPAKLTTMTYDGSDNLVTKIMSNTTV